jgi:hypothetical protein
MYMHLPFLRIGDLSSIVIQQPEDAHPSIRLLGNIQPAISVNGKLLRDDQAARSVATAAELGQEMKIAVIDGNYGF